MIQIERTGRVAFLAMLMLNLSLSIFYNPALAQDPVPETGGQFVQGCPTDQFEITPDVEALFTLQQPIHETLFDSAFTWCEGATWELSQDVAESDITDAWNPVTITGQTIGGENFVADVHYAVTMDWRAADNISNQDRAFAESVDYATRMLGLNVTGTAGSLELWGLLQAFTQPEAGQRVAVFVPSYLGPVIPAVLPEASRRNCDDPKTPLDICICDATVK